jgi:hypothetical protein
VQKIKKFVVFFIILMLFLGVALNIFLFIRVITLEKHIDSLYSESNIEEFCYNEVL